MPRPCCRSTRPSACRPAAARNGPRPWVRWRPSPTTLQPHPRSTTGSRRRGPRTLTPHSSPRSASSNARIATAPASRPISSAARSMRRSAASSCGGACAPRTTGTAFCRPSRGSSPLPARRRSSAPQRSGFRPMMRWSNSSIRAAARPRSRRVFADLKRFLTGFIPEALEAQARRRAARPAKPFRGDFPPERQKMLGVTLMTAVGFDFDHGRLDISHHPFCSGVPSDVRMTTRYTTHEFLSSLMGILHETGHGLYEQGLPAEWQHWPSGKARGMAMHESQSLFQEMQISRTREFWGFALPLARDHLGTEQLAGFEVDDLLAHVQQIEKGYHPRRCRRGDLSAARDPALRDRAGPDRGQSRGEGRARGLGCQDARLPGAVDHRQSEGRTHAGRALAVGRLRLFPELYAGRHDRGAAARRHGARHARPRRADRAAATSRPSTTGAAARSGRRPRWPRPMPSCARPPAKAFRPGTSRTT